MAYCCHAFYVVICILPGPLLKDFQNHHKPDKIEIKERCRNSEPWAAAGILSCSGSEPRSCVCPASTTTHAIQQTKKVALIICQGEVEDPPWAAVQHSDQELLGKNADVHIP